MSGWYNVGSMLPSSNAQLGPCAPQPVLLRLLNKRFRLRNPAVKLSYLAGRYCTLGSELSLLALAQIRLTLATALALHGHRGKHRQRTVVTRQLHETVQVNFP